MTLSKPMIKEYEITYRRSLPDDLNRYLLAKYAQEPFPYEFTEQDLSMNIDRDIRNYEAGELDVTVKSPSELRQEERAYLQNLYIEKCRETIDLEEYVAELEHMLSEHGLESSRMSQRRQIQF